MLADNQHNLFDDSTDNPRYACNYFDMFIGRIDCRFEELLTGKLVKFVLKLHNLCVCSCVHACTCMCMQLK